MRKLFEGRKLLILQIIFVTGLLVSNVIAGKLVNTNLKLGTLEITFPSAVFAYAITFLMTDVIGELYGKKEARMTVYVGFIAQVTASILIFLGQLLPALDEDMQNAYMMLLSQNFMFVVGSLVAYFASQSWDVLIFHKIRNKSIDKHGYNKNKWIWNNASTMTSQIIDTVLFIGIAFGVGMGWLWDLSMYPVLFGLMISQYFIKFLIALFDTPFFYLLTMNSNNISQKY